MENRRSFGAMLITAPSDSERLYEMAVRLTRMEMIPLPHYELYPWLSIRANIYTGDVLIAAGVKAKRGKDGA